MHPTTPPDPASLTPAQRAAWDTLADQIARTEGFLALLRQDQADVAAGVVAGARLPRLTAAPARRVEPDPFETALQRIQREQSAEEAERNAAILQQRRDEAGDAEAFDSQWEILPVAAH